MAHIVKPEVEIMEMDCKKPDKCIPQETEIRDVRLAVAYVPYQKMCTLFSPLEALRKGTVFPELYSPYTGKDKKQRPNGLK